MEMAKSFFGTRDHDGYVGKEEHAVSGCTHRPYVRHKCGQV